MAKASHAHKGTTSPPAQRSPFEKRQALKAMAPTADAPRTPAAAGLEKHEYTGSQAQSKSTRATKALSASAAEVGPGQAGRDVEDRPDHGEDEPPGAARDFGGGGAEPPQEDAVTAAVAAMATAGTRATGQRMGTFLLTRQKKNREKKSAPLRNCRPMKRRSTRVRKATKRSKAPAWRYGDNMGPLRRVRGETTGGAGTPSKGAREAERTAALASNTAGLGGTSSRLVLKTGVVGDDVPTRMEERLSGSRTARCSRPFGRRPKRRGFGPCRSHVRRTGSALGDASSERLRGDKRLVSDGRAKRQCAGGRLAGGSPLGRQDGGSPDGAAVQTPLCRAPSVPQCVSEELRGDFDVVMAALQHRQYEQLTGTPLQHASDELRNNTRIVLAAIESEDGSVLQYASERLKDDETVVLAAIKQKPILWLRTPVLRHASERLKTNEEVVLAALNTLDWNGKVTYKLGDVVRLIPPGMWDNKRAALAVVKRDGMRLQGMATLFDDFDVVLAAVTNNCESLEFASERLRNNKTVVLAAVEAITYGTP